MANFSPANAPLIGLDSVNIPALNSSASKRSGLSLVAAGDSITMGGNAVPSSVLTASNFSSAGFQGSIAWSSFAVPNNTIWLWGFDQPEWNGRKTVTANANNVLTFTNDVPLSPTPTCTSGATSTGTPWVLVESQNNNRNFLALANGLLGLPFSTITNRAVSGTTTVHMVNNFARDVLSLSPTDVWILGGTNDILQSLSVSTAFTNLLSMVTQCVNLGIRVWWSTLPPLTASGGTGTSGSVTTAMQQAVLELNSRIRRNINNNLEGLVRLVDTHAYTCNPAGYDWAAGSSLWSADGTHPTSYAAYNGFAQAFYNAAYQELSRPSPLVDDKNDDYAIFTTSKQLFPDPLMLTTTTSTIAGFSGLGGAGDPTYVTDWVPSREAGTPSASLYVLARADGFGNDQVLQIVTTANNDQISLRMANTAHLNNQIRANVGNTVKLAFEFSVANVPLSAGVSTFGGLDAKIQDSTPTYIWFATGQATPSFLTNGKIIIEGAPFVIPSVWSSANIQSKFTFRFTGNAAGAIFKIGRVQLVLVSA